MKRSTRIFLKSFLLSLLFSAAAASFIILTQIPSYEKQNTSSASAARKFEPTESDKFSLLITFSRGEGESPHTYFLLGFNGREQRVTVSRLFPQTLLSHEGEKKVILNECFDKGGGSGACAALSSYFSIDVSKYICFTDPQALSFFELFEPIALDVPENLSQIDHKNDIYIKIDKGRQIMGGMLILDYLSYTKWDGGESEALFEGARAISEFISQNHSSFALNEGSDIERFILGGTTTNLSVTDIEARRELLSFLLSESGEGVDCLKTDGKFGAQNTEFALSQSSVIKISAHYS